MHAETLIVISEEHTDQFSGAAIAAHSRADVGESYLAAEIGHDPGDAGVFRVDGVLIGDVPDVLAKVLHVAKLDAGLVLRVDLNDIVQERGALILEGRVVFGNEANAALLFSNDKDMRKGGRGRRVDPDLRENWLLDLYTLGDV